MHKCSSTNLDYLTIMFKEKVVIRKIIIIMKKCKIWKCDITYAVWLQLYLKTTQAPKWNLKKRMGENTVKTWLLCSSGKMPGDLPFYVSSVQHHLGVLGGEVTTLTLSPGDTALPKEYSCPARTKRHVLHQSLTHLVTTSLLHISIGPSFPVLTNN